jgi:anti-sigma factor RsiW
MSHLGERLSALIDGELDLAERERVLIHLSRCSSCRDEIAALHTLKRRMNALGDTAANAGLTGRLMGLRDTFCDDELPYPASAGGWLGAQHSGPESRIGRYFLAGSLAAVVAGLGTAAFIVGGGPPTRAPEPAITPSVDVYTVQHDLISGWAPANPPLPASTSSTPPRVP